MMMMINCFVNSLTVENAVSLFPPRTIVRGTYNLNKFWIVAHSFSGSFVPFSGLKKLIPKSYYFHGSVQSFKTLQGPTFLVILFELLQCNVKKNQNLSFSMNSQLTFACLNGNTRKRCEICSKLTIKTPKRKSVTLFWCFYR